MHSFKLKLALGFLGSFALLFSGGGDILADYSIQNTTEPKYQRDRFTTDIFTGSANYSYPIKVPKGTNDLTPEVSINYSSTGLRDMKMNSGIGWLLNQQYIQRDVNGTPTNTSDDKFKLYFKGAVYELVYVSSDGLYHTKIESYLKIQKLTGGSNVKGEYWVVTTPDGTKYRFGYESQSERECNDRDFVTMWNLDLVTDTNSNKIYYTYGETYGWSYLERIKYNNDQSRIIKFHYVDSGSSNPAHGYTRPVFVQGCYMFDPNNLDNIEVYIGEDLVREYDLNYTPTFSNQPLLTSIIEKGDDRSNYLTTSFEYNNEPRSWNATPETWINQDINLNLGQDNVTLSDVNGDGYMDVVGTDFNGGINFTWKVLINTGTSWPTQWTNWVTNAGINAGLDPQFTPYVRLIDVTGDNLPDIVRSPDADVWQVFRNTGTSWNTTAENWTNLSGVDGSIKLRENDVTLADMTGDGLPDIVHTKANNGGYQWEVFKNTGSGWSTTRDVWVDGTNMPAGLGSPQVRLIDVNNDGISDVVRTVYDGNWATWYVWLNTGSGFRGFTIWLDYSVNAHFQEPQSTISDANGDGLIDIVRNENQDPGGADRWKVLVSRGDHWTDQWDNWIEYSANVDINANDNKTKLTDVTGDGLPDIVKGDFSSWKVYKNNGNAPHLLKQVTTDRGGVVNFEYKPSTIYDNTGSDSKSDLSFPVWVVSKMTVNNGLDNDQETNDVTTYSYQDGFYDHNLKQFQGFSIVNTVEPNGSKKKYVFHQYETLTGKLSELQERDSSNNPYRETQPTWSYTTTNGVTVTKQTEEKILTYDGSASNPKIKQTNFEYDSYGNVTKKSELGDTGVSGDERYTYNEYTYNTTDWIVNTAKKTTLKASNDSTKISETSFYYDSHSGLGDAPSKGNLTKEVKWTDGLFTTDPTTNYTYDSFGNQTEVEDANGHYTYTNYDTTGTYPTFSMNAKDHETYVHYDLGTGNLLYKTDPNGNTTDYEYDVYGRLTKEIKPGDNSTYPTTKYTYYTAGVDGTLVSKKENTGSSSATLDTYTWIDGLGRTISTRTEAEATSSAKQIVTNTYYDSTGQVNKVTVPHEDDSYDYYRNPLSGIRNTQTTYDAIGRPVTITNPKGDNKTIAYDHWKETTTDENGNVKKEYKNAFDKIVKVEEVNDAATYETTYAYDSRDLLMQITDDEDNDITFTYDALGRKTSMTDPDMGTWEYEYDAVGNLTKQTDNRDVQVVKTYDEINRLKKTDYPTNTDVVYTYDGNSRKGTLTSVTDAAGSVSYTYDNLLRKTAEARTVGGVTKTTQFAYDPMDRVRTQTNPDSEVITNTYNNQGEIESVSNVVSNVNYNALGKITQKNFNNGLTTNYTYNTNDFRLNRIQTSSLQDLNYAYDNVGNVASITDAVDSKTQTFTYDDLDRLKTASESAGYNYAYQYSSIGNLTKFTDSGVDTDYGYGANGKVHAMTSSTEKVAPPHVNGSGTPLTSSLFDTWSSGTINSTKWNIWGGGQVTVSSNQLAMTSTTGGGYYGVDSDVNGKLYDLTSSSIVNEVVNAGNQSIGSWEVYPIYAYIDGDSSNQFFFFIGEGKLRAYKKVNGASNWLAQDDYNPAVHKWFRIRESGGTTYFDTSANGTTWTNFASVANPFAVTEMVIGSEVGTWSSEGSTTSATFDNFNYASAPTATLVDDWSTGSIDSGRWVNWGGSNATVSAQQFTATSNAGGGYYGIDSSNAYNLTNSSVVTQVVNAGNQSLGSWEVFPLYTIVDGDNSNQFFFFIGENKIRAYKKVNGTSNWLAQDDYNPAVHKWFRIRESAGTTYFDTSADGGTWSNFASVANPFPVSSMIVGQQVGTWSSEASTTSAIFDNFNVWHPVYAYDANGNLTSDGTKCYEYNEANQLSKVKECGNSHTIAEYVYDYNGLRMVKKNYVTGTLANTVVSWSDGYETKTPVGGSAQNTAYYWVNGELLSKRDNSGNRFYYQNDHLGSASLLTNSGGSVSEETSYDPWGVVKSGGGKSKFQYTGQEKDSETGLNYYNARYYSSDMRRFTQPDLVVKNVYEPQTLNSYSYVQNNPVKYTDPSGHVNEILKYNQALNAYYQKPTTATYYNYVVVTKSIQNGSINNSVYNTGAGNNQPQKDTSGGRDVLKPQATAIYNSLYREAVNTLRNPNSSLADKGGAGFDIGASFIFGEVKLAAKGIKAGKILNATDAINASAQMKRLNSGEIEMLKKAGFDIHDLKGQQSGVDIYKDDTGELFLKPLSGKGEPDQLNINIKNL